MFFVLLYVSELQAGFFYKIYLEGVVKIRECISLRFIQDVFKQLSYPCTLY
jgi:hypothetical protein